MTAGKIKDAYTKEYQTIREDQPLSQALSQINRAHPPLLVVTDDQGDYMGILLRRAIALAKVDPTTTKVSSLMRKAPTVDVNDKFELAARLMLESEIRQLPVFRGKKLVGFVTHIRLIHDAVLDAEWGKTPVKEIMTKNPMVVDAEDEVGVVIDLFQDQGFNHVPVMSDGDLVGLVSGGDIVNFIRAPKKRQTIGERVGEKIARLSIPAKSIMSTPVITIAPDATLKAADEKMHKHNISWLIVTEEKNKVMGIVTRRDFLEPLAQMDYKQLKIYVQFSIKEDIEIHAVERRHIMEDFDSFAKRFGEVLKGGALFVYMKSHGSSYKGDQLIHCRLQLRTRIGAFYSASEGWDVEQTFRMALDRLERQILRSKELEFNAQFAHTYLKRLGVFEEQSRGGE